MKALICAEIFYQQILMANKVKFRLQHLEPRLVQHTVWANWVGRQQQISAAARQCAYLCPLTGSSFMPG